MQEIKLGYESRRHWEWVITQANLFSTNRSPAEATTVLAGYLHQ